MAKKKSPKPRQQPSGPQASNEQIAERMFRAAASFEYAHLLLSRDNKERDKRRGSYKPGEWQDYSFIDALTQWTPTMVAGMLAVEIYFKCIQKIDTGKYAWGHRIDELYRGLGSSRQQRIEAKYNERFGKHGTIPHGAHPPLDVSLDGMLKASSNLFEEGRYWFEGGRTWTVAGPTAIAAAARGTILEIKPEWERIVEQIGQ